MSQLLLILRDSKRELHAASDSEFVECVVAGLSAEPETIEELGHAVERFVEPGEWINFRAAAPVAEQASENARIVVVDLAAHLVIADEAFFPKMRRSRNTLGDDGAETEVAPPPLRLSDDWLLSGELSSWRELADARRRHWSENPPLDARAVLYGEPLIAFVARECWVVFRDRASLPICDQDEPAFREAYNEEYDLLRAIHERWMMTPRDDLRGYAPRDVMLAKREMINWDLQDRSSQWSYEGHCPRGLDPNSAGYRFAGFGTHELVVYYDMVRHLLWSCRDGVAEFVQPLDAEALSAGDFVTGEVAELAREREKWLDASDPEMHGRTPRSIIHNERARLPEGVTGGEMMVDHDCPLCQMQADLPGPMFWGLDGCNMDDDFAFSFHRTYDEWEAEQREYEEFNRRFEAKEAESKRLGVEYPGGGAGDPDYVWRQSFSANSEPAKSAIMRLFGIGSHLTELVVDLKERSGSDGRSWAADPDELPAENRALVDGLSRDFGNLRQIARADDFDSAEALAGPIVDRFCETLNTVATARPQLERKCVELQKKLRTFFDPTHTADRFDETSDDEELPF